MSRLLDETDPVAVLDEIGRLALLIPKEAIERYAEAGGMRIEIKSYGPRDNWYGTDQPWAYSYCDSPELGCDPSDAWPREVFTQCACVRRRY